MDYVGNLFRPPSEGRSMIIQTTVGCSHNQCTFCGAYKDKKFYVKDLALIKRDIDEASKYKGYFDKVFLADGDVLIMPTNTIIDIMTYIHKKCPWTERIGVYGNTKAILKKTPQELKELKDAGLLIVYHGIESGNKEVLRRIKKGAFPNKMLEASQKIINAGIELSQTVLLGLGGTELSEEHAVDTGKLLSEMSPDYASALTVMLLPYTELGQAAEKGTFQLPGKFGMLKELRLMIENMNMKRKCFFTSNHASNYLPIRAFLPKDKNTVLELIDAVVAKGDENILRPEYMRAL
ncbi:MAG: radical SAM protein [Leptospirales bacterium]|nr:radical SAM protein [Leptospirales bacterium]